MAISSVNKLDNQRKQFRGVVDNVIEYEAIWDPDNVGSNGEFHESITVPGAKMNDIVLVSFAVDQQDMDLHAYVESADSVRIGLNNATAGAVNLASGHLHILILQLSHMVG